MASFLMEHVWGTIGYVAYTTMLSETADVPVPHIATLGPALWAAVHGCITHDTTVLCIHTEDGALPWREENGRSAT